jgi:hypothetical protein
MQSGPVDPRPEALTRVSLLTFTHTSRSRIRPSPQENARYLRVTCRVGDSSRVRPNKLGGTPPALRRRPGEVEQVGHVPTGDRI